MLSFEWPWMFILLPLPWLVRRYCKPLNADSAALKIPFAARVAVSSQTLPAVSLSSLKYFLLLASWLCVLFAAARPVSLGDPIPIKQSSRDLMLAVDISESMSQRDMDIDRQRVPRLVAVKVILNDFLKKRKGDQIGLILFGSNAYLQSPLTYDIDTVAQFLVEAQIGLAGERTAIGDALGLSIKRLYERPESQRVVILLTDGENTAGELSPIDSIALAQEAKVKIYTIAIGPSVFSNVDKRLLSTIASETGGQFFNARNSSELLAIYDYIDEIEEIQSDEQFYRPRNALFRIPLACSYIFIGLIFFAQYLPSSFKRGVSANNHG